MFGAVMAQAVKAYDKVQGVNKNLRKKKKKLTDQRDAWRDSIRQQAIGAVFGNKSKGNRSKMRSVNRGTWV